MSNSSNRNEKINLREKSANKRNIKSKHKINNNKKVLQNTKNENKTKINKINNILVFFDVVRLQI